MNFFKTCITRKAAIGIVLAGIACSTPAVAEVLAYWNPAGTVDSTSPLAPATVSTNLASAGNLTGGPGLTSPGPFANAYEFDNWSAGALDTSDYLAFSTTGDNVTYATVAFSLYNNFDGTGSWEIRSSADGFASALDSGTFSGIFFAGELITANVAALGVRSGSVEFRIYTFNNAGDTNPLQRGIRGTGGEGFGLTVNGTVGSGPVQTASVRPAPALGLGRWLLLAGLLFAAWRVVEARRNKSQ